jgi:hypothetical protein
MADTLTFTKMPLIYCTCGGIPMETAGKQCLMTGVGDTVAAGEGKLTSHPFHKGCTLALAQVITMEAATDDDSFPAIIEGVASEIDTVPIELTNGADLSDLTGCKAVMIGR